MNYKFSMTVEHPNFYQDWCLSLLSPEHYFIGEEAMARQELHCSCTKTNPDPGSGYLDCGSGLSPADHYSTCCSIFSDPCHSLFRDFLENYIHEQADGRQSEGTEPSHGDQTDLKLEGHLEHISVCGYVG